LQAFVTENTTPETIVYTDEASAYSGLPREHVAVKHSVGEYVREQAHTNGLESFWSVLKRGFNGTFHHISPKHLHRYIGEFSGRHNDRPSDTIEQMTHMVQAMEGKRLRYADLISGGPAYPQEIEF
jgi:transposase-like protein